MHKILIYKYIKGKNKLKFYINYIINSIFCIHIAYKNIMVLKIDFIIWLYH